MFTSAIVPLDGSPEANAAMAPAASLVAKGGNVILLGVLPRTDLLAPALLDMLPVPDIRLAMRESIGEHLERAGEPLSARAIRWETEVREGDPASQILAAAEEHRAGFIAMSIRGRGASGRELIGSIADRVARSSPVPVLLVRPGAPDGTPTMPFRRIVAPLDGSPRAEAAIPVAARIAAGLNVPVLLVQAIDSRMLAAPLSHEALPAISARMLQTLRDDAAFYLTEACDRFGRHRNGSGRSFSWQVLEGSPCDAVTGVLRGGDLLVLTSHGRGGVTRWALGSVAEKLLRDSSAPVLLVRADQDTPNHVQRTP